MTADDDFVRPVRGSRWSDLQSRDALQAIAEGVAEVAGFDLVGVTIARDDGYLHTLVIVGPEEARRVLIDSLAPTHMMLEQLRTAEDWGALKFISHDKLVLDVEKWGWFSDAPRDVPAGAWHPEDMLIAPLEDDDGRFLGFLGMELPRDGLVPSADKRRLLEIYARQATRAVRTTLERERLSEQVRLTSAAADIVRLASSTDSPDEILAACGREITKGFRADSLWLQRIGADRRCSGPLYVDGGPTVRLPAGVRALVSAHAQRAWERQCVAVIAPERPMPGALAADQAETVLEFLASVEIESLLFVPIGSGADCFGVLGLTRGRMGAEWSETEAATALDIGRDLGRSIREHQLVQELRDIADYRSRMVATVAHELKNPVSAVLGYAEILDGDRDLDPTERTAVTAIRRAGQRLSRVVDDLLTLHGTTESAPAAAGRVDLVALVGEVLELNTPLAGSLGLELRAELPDEPVVARGDDGELDHVVTNLVSNALKYTPRGGTVTVTVTPQGGEAVVAVADDGIGIAAEDLARVFDEFYRSGDPAATAQPGTGLGLAIVRRLVERNGGRIEVDSELGRGSTFRAALPLA